MLDCYAKRRTRFALRHKRLFEIIEVEISRVDCTRFGDKVKVLILEVPYFSAAIRNFHKGHPYQTAFQVTNKILFNRISYLNERIKSLNRGHGVTSPSICADLIGCITSNKNHPSKSVSYSLLLNGLHPSATLRKYYIRHRVLSVICKLCFHEFKLKSISKVLTNMCSELS